MKEQPTKQQPGWVEHAAVGPGGVEVDADMAAALKPCPPVCDTCRFYAFNGDDSGAYIGNGRCEHPNHPKRCEPEDGCEDFDCSVHPKAAA